MKRDPEFLRAILVEFEASDSYVVVLRHYLGMQGLDAKRWYHCQLACDSELVAQVSESGFRLTPHGHDFLDAIRNERRWKKILALLAKTGGDWTMALLKQWAFEALRMDSLIGTEDEQPS